MKEEHLQKKVCPIDGIEFIAKRSDAVYCSNRCRTRAMRERQLTRTTQQLHSQQIWMDIFLHNVSDEYIEMIRTLENEHGFDAAYDAAQMLGKILKLDF